MTLSKTPALALLLATLAVGSSCRDDNPDGLATAEQPPAKECIREKPPRSYEVYFVIDVSGSMGPFLNDLKQELVTLSLNFPEYDAEGHRVLVDYYVLAFVNDHKWYPVGAHRMTSHIDVQAAFEEAIAAGANGTNLDGFTPNAEARENLLDAIVEVIESNPGAEAKLMFIATDAPFAETPDTLSGNNEVNASFAAVAADLASLDFRVHAFTQAELDGLTRTYNNMPPLTDIPGSSSYNLTNLIGAREEIRSTLSGIAQDAACN